MVLFSGGYKLAYHELTQEGKIFVDKLLNLAEEIS